MVVPSSGRFYCSLFCGTITFASPPSVVSRAVFGAWPTRAAGALCARAQSPSRHTDRWARRADFAARLVLSGYVRWAVSSVVDQLGRVAPGSRSRCKLSRAARKFECNVCLLEVAGWINDLASAVSPLRLPQTSVVRAVTQHSLFMMLDTVLVWA